MSTEKQTFAVKFGGQDYHLSLRLADDGFIPAFEETAAQLIVFPFVTSECRLPDEFWMNEARVCALLALITEEGRRGGWIAESPTGERKFTPFPWGSFYDLEISALKEIALGFTARLNEKMQRLAPSMTFIGINLPEAFSSVSEMLLTKPTATRSRRRKA